MSEQSLTILAIFAHPDDEIGVGSTLAHYAARGVRTVLVCATRGEAATIFCADCATRETLAEVRTGELTCACEHLGIGELRWLDWPDGGVKDLPREAAIGQIVRVIREIRPQVLLTHPENGLYPHPDHLAVWEIVRAAFTAAADDEADGEAGPTWAPARLFTRAMPQSLFERAPGLKDFRVELNGQLLPFYGTPDAEIDVRMAVAPHVPQRMAAWDCHRSQHNPKGFSSVMPDGLRQEIAEIEHFQLVAARVPLSERVHDDLLAGLDDAVTAGLQPSAGFDAVARRELAVARALVELSRRHLTRMSEAKYEGTLRATIDHQMIVIQKLSRALRLTGGVVGDVAPDPALYRHGAQIEQSEDQVRYLETHAQQAALRFQRHAAAAEDAALKTLWAGLAAGADA